MANINRGNPIKSKSVITILFEFMLGVWFVLPLIIFRPFKEIYFAPLRTDRIGHFIQDTEILIAQINSESTKRKKNILVFWFCSSIISNMYVYSIWNSILRVIAYSRISSAIYSTAVVVEKICKIKLTFRHKTYDDLYSYVYLLEQCAPVFGMPHEDSEECKNILKSVGIDTSLNWVCILNRDQGYLRHMYPHLDWEFNEYRNSNIETYVSAAEYLAEKKIMIFRMRSHVEKSFSSSNSTMLIDYANCSWRTEKLDIYLTSRCLFMVSSGTGLDAVAVALRKPLLMVNSTQPLNLYKSKSQHIIIFKKFLDKKTGNYLSPTQYYHMGIKYGFTVDNQLHLRSQDLVKLEIEVVDNTQEEIREAVEEMYQLITNKNQFNENFSKQQIKFWENFPKIGLYLNDSQVNCKVGDKFLANNQWLLH